MLQLYDNPVHVGWDESGREIIVGELSGSSSSELPSLYSINGKVLHEGSRFWNISTGDHYGLKSDGTWIKQDHNPGPPIW
jgi:hypothetical protein